METNLSVVGRKHKTRAAVIFGIRNILVSILNGWRPDTEVDGGFSSMKKRAWLMHILLLMLAAPAAWAQQNIPDAILRVTVQQKEKGKMNSDLHFQELRCWRGTCSLITVTLNSCRPSPISAGKASPLIIERTSTNDGTLAVSREGNTLVVVENGSDMGGNYVTTQRFTYEQTTDAGIITRLTDYSGGFVKNSAAVKQVLTVEFVPFRRAYKEARLDCPLNLPGVDASR